MPYRYLTCDVFTDVRFGGNQLAVFPDARGLSDAQMLAITREFNYSETTFVLPPDDPGNTRRVRIFTPGAEVPFAGHPNVGTAHVLAVTGDIPLTGDETRVVFEEGVGPVPILIRSENGRPVFTQLSVAKLPEITPAPASRETLAEVLSLDPSALLDGDYAPRISSCGLPFLMVPLRDRDAVAHARIRTEPWERFLKGKMGQDVFVFTMGGERAGSDVHARMFAPAFSVAEDPATGSACAALGGYLGMRTPRDGALRWVVEQGIEMGRPSILEVEVDKQGGTITAVRVGGRTVMVMEGTLTV